MLLPSLSFLCWQLQYQIWEDSFSHQQIFDDNTPRILNPKDDVMYSYLNPYSLFVCRDSREYPGPFSFQILPWHLAVSPLSLATVGEENQQSHHSEIFWLLRGCQLFSASSYPFCAGFFSESLLPALLSCVYLRDIVDDRVQGSNHHHSRVLRTALDT
ncbi:hypothetical protein BKA61DRAFT_623197 [Leptodontidium sp. MPI-SDFR-AT-0119]|nr:hypothetical protein BKA61DRAFT_623197 [Leptodontidium sp. MPI-SDFR-AT-0119]